MTSQKIQPLLALFLYFCLGAGCLSAEELDLKKVKQLESAVLSGLNDKQALLSLEELSRFYLSQHRYNQFVDFLQKIETKTFKPCSLPYLYYLGLARYGQLKYLEETESWKEYFDSGNSYRREVFSATEKIVKDCPSSAFGLKAQLINWLLHKAQNDAQGNDALDKLVEMAENYAKSVEADLDLGVPKNMPWIESLAVSSGINVVKEVADSLLKEGEEAKARSVYKFYANGLIAGQGQEERLLAYAQAALGEGNTELSEIIYRRFIETIKGSYSKDNLANELIPIAREFAASGREQGKDPLFAEGIFKDLMACCGAPYFKEDLQYLRAYNLQRLKDYLRSAEEYEVLIKDFPAAIYIDEAEFKLGILYIYILGQEDKGLTYLEEIIKRNSSKEYVLEGLYHKSLISQYRKDLESAASGYAKILDLVDGDNNFENLTGRVRLRQKEIAEPKEIEYNLKTFLDNALAEGGLSEAGLELTASPAKAFSAEKINFSLAAIPGDTGCLSPEVTYLWSGDLGSISLVPAQAVFQTEYLSPGTKVVNLVVLSPSGNIASALEIVDITNQK